MGILLAFLPFIVFALLDRLLGPLPGLAAATAVSAVMVARDAVSAERSPKILEIGSLVLFGALTLYMVVATPDLSIMAVRLLVDSGLLLVVLISLVVGVPFTLQYAREQVPREHWSSPTFRHTNMVITAVWALAFAVIVAADAVLLFNPDVSLHTGTLVIVAALLVAFKFTTWYPQRARASASQRP